VTVIWVPYHLDEHLPGLDLLLAPDAVIAPEPLPGRRPGGAWERLAALYRPVAAAVAGAATGGQCPVVVSGDCTTALGTVAGLQQAGVSPGIVWFDAHGDVHTPETTASGYLGGMPLRLLAGYRPGLIAERLGLRPVPEDRITLVGARDLDPPEVSYLASAPVRRADVTASLAGPPDVPWYVHVDLDVLDPAVVPGLRYPAPGGASAGQLAAALGALMATGRVAAIGIACTWYPGHGAAARLTPHVETALATGG
jgi:arginase